MIDEMFKRFRDGTSIGVRIYRLMAQVHIRPAGGSAYRFDNNSLPASAQFLWRERAIEW